MPSAPRHRPSRRILARALVALVAPAVTGCGVPEKLAGVPTKTYIAVEGRVTDATGAAVKDAQVAIWSETAAGSCAPPGGAPDESALTNIRGSFSRVLEYFIDWPATCITVTVTPRVGTGLQPATLTRPALTPSATRGAAVARFDVVLSR